MVAAAIICSCYIYAHAYVWARLCGGYRISVCPPIYLFSCSSLPSLPCIYLPPLPSLPSQPSPPVDNSLNVYKLTVCVCACKTFLLSIATVNLISTHTHTHLLSTHTHIHTSTRLGVMETGVARTVQRLYVTWKTSV